MLANACSMAVQLGRQGMTVGCCFGSVTPPQAEHLLLCTSCAQPHSMSFRMVYKTLNSLIHLCILASLAAYHFCRENTRTFRLLSATSSVQPSWRATAFHRGIHPKTAGSAKQMIDPKASVRFCTVTASLDNCTTQRGYYGSRFILMLVTTGKHPRKAPLHVGKVGAVGYLYTREHQLGRAMRC